MRKEPCRYRPESSGPIEIIPHLFLGNKKDSVDRKCLEDHKIRYVLNVTHDLPNEFENEKSFNYLKLPVEDNWEGNLISLFPQAFAFIGKLNYLHTSKLNVAPYVVLILLFSAPPAALKGFLYF